MVTTPPSMRSTVSSEGPAPPSSDSSSVVPSSLEDSSVVPSSLVGSSSVGSSWVGSSSPGASGVSCWAAASVTPGVLTPFAAAAGVGSKRTQPCSGPNHTSGQACAFFALTVH